MTDRKFPTPEEIQKEFEEFVKKRFGGSVQVLSRDLGGGAESDGNLNQDATNMRAEDGEKATDQTGSHPLDDIRNFDKKPTEIKAYLDRFVIKQSEAKKALAIAVCDHYNHVTSELNQTWDDRTEADPTQEVSASPFSKQNVLLLGPTGVGKTYLIRQLAKFIGVPFVKADATRFSETGYVGANVDDLIRDLVSQAGGDTELAQFGIVYLDEADKLAASSSSQVKDVSGRGVQFGLLKLMEESEVDLSNGNDMRSQMQAIMDYQRKGKVEKKVINTRNILFIVSGAFHGLSEIIAERLNKRSIGFAAGETAAIPNEELLGEARTEDFITYGFEPEFIGRLPIQVACHHLDETDLVSILQNSEGSLLKQYEAAFAAYDIGISFTEGALYRIANLAASQKTGARALMTVCERLLRQFKFELPATEVKQLQVDEALIDNPDLALRKLLENPETAEQQSKRQEVRTAEQEFERQHHLRVCFDRPATARLIGLATKQGRSIAETVNEILSSYEHGLKLIEQLTGQKQFDFGTEVIDDPKNTLEKLIRKSYQAPLIH